MAYMNTNKTEYERGYQDGVHDFLLYELSFNYFNINGDYELRDIIKKNYCHDDYNSDDNKNYQKAFDEGYHNGYEDGYSKAMENNAHYDKDECDYGDVYNTDNLYYE